MREHPGEFELTGLAEAADYRKTLAILEEERAAASGGRVAPSSPERAIA
ncbi:hypothetical protein ACLESO_25320 [Pyxidicoccus sp. 3LG]